MPEVRWKPVTCCRACDQPRLVPVFSFGDSPLSDRLGEKPNSLDQAAVVPLELVFCPSCRLLQLSVNVAPDELYDDSYPYYTSVSSALLCHFQEYAEEIIETYKIGPGSKVVEAASNDGYLLHHFDGVGASVQGYDPSGGPARVALGRGISTEIVFFGREAAQDYMTRNGCADLFLANNVLAHVPDLTDFVEGIATVLKPHGVAVIEVPYLADLVLKGEFDTIYHQHLCYFSINSLNVLFSNAGMTLYRVDHQPIHGGSIRLHVVNYRIDNPEVEILIQDEYEKGWNSLDFVQRIGRKAVSTKKQLLELVSSLKRDGKSIWAYGAAAKANTLMTWCDLGSVELEAVADLNTRKHGLFMPGSDLKIRSPEELIGVQPDYVLILAWNFADEIMAQLSQYKDDGGRFIIPIPELKVV